MGGERECVGQKAASPCHDNGESLSAKESLTRLLESLDGGGSETVLKEQCCSAVAGIKSDRLLESPEGVREVPSTPPTRAPGARA